MYYLRQLTILHYITELFVSHSAIGLAIHVNNLLYLVTRQMRLSTTAKTQAANKLQGTKTKQNNLPWPSTIATLSNQDHGGNENVSKECIQTTAVNHSKESSWIYALLNFIAPKLQSRSHWQRCSNFLIYEFWGAVSEFNKRTDKSFFDVRVRTDADEYDCKRHWKCHWWLTKVLFRFTTNVPTCSVCQIYENFPSFELFRQLWIKSTKEPYLLVYKESGKLTLSCVFNTDMR